MSSADTCVLVKCGGHFRRRPMTAPTLRTVPVTARARRIAPRRAPAPAARRSRPDADRARGRALLQGVRLARSSAGRRARPRRPSTGSPRAWASTRASSRAASPPTSARASRRRSPARTRSTSARRTTRRSRSTRRSRASSLDRLGRARAARAVGRGLGAAAPRRRPAGDRAARARARRFVEGAGVRRRRPRRRAVPPRRLPLQAPEHLHGDRPLQRGARAGGALASCRATSFARRSSAGARAATGASATSRPRARTSSVRSSSRRGSRTGAARRNVLPGLARRRAPRATGPRAHVRRAREGALRGARDESHVGRLLNNLGGLNFLLGKPEQAVELPEGPFAVALELGTTPTPRPPSRRSRRCTSAPASLALAEEQARQALELLDGRED